MIDSALAAAYRATQFWVDDAAPGKPFVIRCGERCEELDFLLAQSGQGFQGVKMAVFCGFWCN